MSTSAPMTRTRRRNDVKSVFETRGIEFAPQRLYNRAEDERTVSNMIILVKVFSYGFIALISLISVANVFNTVSTNVALRRRDYAMLRSLGMTNRGMNRMMNYECLLYGTRSLLFGLPLSVGMTYLCYLSAAEWRTDELHNAVDGGCDCCSERFHGCVCFNAVLNKQVKARKPG